MGRFAAFATAILVALALSWSAPAAAQETSGEYRQALTGLTNEMQALTQEIEGFRVNSRYCKPPQIPTKAEAQAALDELAQRAEALSQRYNALKQSLKDFARNPRVAAEMMLRDVDPSAERWWTQYERSRQRMLDALARKRAALAAAPELNCAPKPKPQPVVAVPTFQAPATPQRPAADALIWPPFPPHFCSWDDYWAFVNQLNQLTERVAENAERAAKYRADVERAINAYVQNDRPVPRQLLEQRRQANADYEGATRRLAEADANVRRAKAIPVIDCRQPRQQQEPPRTEPPRPDATPPTTTGPKFQTGSVLDGIRNRAWAKVEEMKADYDRCDAAAYERALRELERLLEEAKLARGAATGAGEFSNVKPEEAEGLVDALRSIIEPRRWLLLELKRKCREPSRAQPPTTPSQTGFIPPPDRRMAILLEEHNKARAEVASRPLHWDPQLAANAAAHAGQLARTGQLTHASREGRGIERENLSQGMLGWSPQQMLGNWVREKRNFVPGMYPNVSRTGRWEDVSHYTQMIWPTTTNLGCGLASGSGFQWLVCRYSPGGNKDGKPILADNSGIAPPNSSTPTLPDLPKLPVGGGMTQIDPPAPPPPPPPTARDDAPGGNEDNHPLVGYGAEAFIRHSAAVDCGNQAAADAELAKLRYAIDELRKRLKAAKKAGKFSAVKPEDVQRQINLLESFLRAAEQRRPRDTCPIPSPPAPPPAPPPPPPP